MPLVLDAAVLGKMADGDVCFSFDGCDCESGVCEDDYSSKLGLGRCGTCSTVQQTDTCSCRFPVVLVNGDHFLVSHAQHVKRGTKIYRVEEEMWRARPLSSKREGGASGGLLSAALRTCIHIRAKTLIVLIKTDTTELMETS